MNFSNRRSITKIVLLATCFTVATVVAGCSQGSDIERTGNKVEKKLTGKMTSGGKLNSSEINSLSGVYLLKKQYREGISVLEQLSNDNKYKTDQYLIYLNLSKFYLGQASENKSNQEKAGLLEKAKQYLSLGVDAAQEKAAALYVRSQIYGYEGCIEKAKKDLHDARDLAGRKELILFEDGVYVDKAKFSSLLQTALDGLSKYPDNCEIH